ncbi:hypothetical protein A7K91_13950 [Paenibacillus oryzae]|uniref:Uncharacterized protein n=1 Tax=Paenibacillus oryzae TaxID=1844972 RepID=A0A1A5YJV8_9BACL|nr:hypothetical protein A7K91_13950 [Paenibacillus oryzae]
MPIIYDEEKHLICHTIAYFICIQPTVNVVSRELPELMAWRRAKNQLFAKRFLPKANFNI